MIELYGWLLSTTYGLLMCVWGGGGVHCALHPATQAL